MANIEYEASESDFDEVFVIPVPADREDDDPETEIVFPIVSEEEANELLAS